MNVSVNTFYCFSAAPTSRIQYIIITTHWAHNLLRRGRYYDETRDDRHEIQEDEDRNEVNYTAVTG